MANRASNHEEARALAEWYRQAGVDMAVGEAPVDRFKASSMAAQRPAPAVAMSAQPSGNGPSAPPAEPGTDDPAAAEALAAKAQSLPELEAILRDFDGCGLKARATQLVFADGNPEGDVMLIGEAPGREEDLQGKPFVGRSGQLLDRMLAAIGLDRTRVYIANTVPWRPPGNRTPTPSEIATCLPFLFRQIELAAPKIIMTLGAPAAQTIFNTKTPISRMRGQWRDIEINGHAYKALPSLHPAYLLRQPAQKALAWRDMLSLKAELERLG